jgi:hypothetical protein
VHERGYVCGLRGRRSYGLLGAAFASYENANALDHLSGRGGSFGEEDIGVEGAIEGIDSAGDDHRGQARMELFSAANQFVAVHLRHEEIAEDEVEAAGKRAFQGLERLLCGLHCDDSVSTGFEKKGADGEYLFVVIYAEDRLLGAHVVSLLPDATLWWLAADGPVRRFCWFADAPVWWRSKLPRGPAEYGRSTRDGSPAPGEQKT